MSAPFDEAAMEALELRRSVRRLQRHDDYWRRAHEAENRPMPEDWDTEARADWEDTVVDRLYDEPSDPLEREPMGGNPWWKDGV